MDEELTTEGTEQPEPEVAEAPEFDIEAERAAVAAEKAEIEKQEKALRKGFDKIARRERELAAPKPEPVDEDLGLTPEAEKVLDRFVSRKTAEQSAMVERIWQDMAQSTVADKAKEYGVEVEDLERVIVERGLQPKGVGRTDIAEMAEMAYKIHRADTFNLDAERERIKAEILEELSSEGVDIVSVKQGKSDVDAPVEGDIYEMEPAQRMAYYESKGMI